MQHSDSNASSSQTLRDVFRILLRHKKKGMLVFMLTLAATAAAIIWCPRSYRSEARLFVRVGRESVALDPTATTAGQTVKINRSQESEIASILAALKSRSLAEKVVDQIGADAILNPPVEAEADPPAKHVLRRLIDPVIGAVRGLDPVSERELAVTLLQDSLDISAAADSAVINIGYKAKSPRQAQRIVSGLTESYLAEHLRINRTHGSFEFFSQQSKLLETQLEAATQSLRDAKNESGLTTIEGQRELLQSQLTTLQQEGHLTQVALASSRAKRDRLRQQLANLPEKAESEETNLPNLLADAMHERLYQLQIQEVELTSKYGANHPSVATIHKQVIDAERIHAQQAQSRQQSKHSANPVYQDLFLALATEEAEQAGLNERSRALADRLARVEAGLKEFNNREVKIARLARKVDLCAANLQTYAQNLEQARVDQALEADRISNVNVLQPASYVAKPVRPNKTMTAALGLLAALTGAMGITFLAERFDTTLKTPLEVESKLGLPVLLSMPRSPSSDKPAAPRKLG